LQPAAAARNGAEPKPEASRAALAGAIERWQRLLKKIRRAAGSVRDLDVHRKILAGLLKDLDRDRLSRGRSTDEPGGSRPENSYPDHSGNPRPSEPPQPLSGLHAQADDLDAWLRHSRHEASQPLTRGARKWAARLDDRLSALAEVLAQPGCVPRKPLSPAATALEAFARLSHEMEQLSAYNLHDFRKGAKKARYMAEAGGDDEYAGAIGKALKKLQDEIGDWHDWLVLAEEAHRALGDTGVELIARIEQERDERYLRAMKTSERMRGRLMGEWHAATERSRTAQPRAQPRAQP
jgi:CHAD domain-containing protein